MIDDARQKSTALLLLALVLGTSAGWYLGRLLGLNADLWFVEPEFHFELLTGACGYAFGLLFALTRNQSAFLKFMGASTTAGFSVSIITYCHFSSDVPSHKISTALYVPELLIQTSGSWLTALLGAISVWLFRIISR